MNPVKSDQTLLPPIADDVAMGLSASPKRLPPWLFYDEAGSALFVEITRLPEYYLTRIESALLRKYADEILERAGNDLTLIELGAGTAAKTQLLIESLLKRQKSAAFYPMDVSESALAIAERNLTARFPPLTVRPLLGDYAQGLKQLSKTPGRKLVLYIGSSIGNYEPDEAGTLLRAIRDSLREGDAMLLGTDMVKDEATMIAAYNDAAGITARFNLNVLARINRELGADFDPDAYGHIALWNAEKSRIEMHLESRKAQTVRIRDLSLSVRLAEGERIHTENSYKFTSNLIRKILLDGGFKLEKNWFDPQLWFGVYLARV